MSDHARGCEGRNYQCSCGYDAEVDDEIERLTRELAEARKVAVPVMAALTAAISLLERSPKSAAPSDKMFDLMMSDYRRALNNARAMIARLDAAEPKP